MHPGRAVPSPEQTHLRDGSVRRGDHDNRAKKGALCIPIRVDAAVALLSQRGNPVEYLPGNATLLHRAQVPSARPNESVRTRNNQQDQFSQRR